MRTRDLASSLFWMGIGLVFLIGAIGYGFGTTGVPGPGFLPFLTALGLMGLSLVLFFTALTKKSSDSVPHMVAEDFPKKEGTKRILKVLGSMVFYTFAVERLGFPLTSFVFMVFLLRLEPRRWSLVFFSAAGFTALFYGLFKVLLRVPLPSGVLGF